jgi:hypothetical protein
MNKELSIYWLFFHLIQVSIFQFYAVRKLSNLSYSLIKKRNTEVAEKILPASGMLHSKYIDIGIGIICFGLLIFGFVSQNFYIYWTGKYLSLFGFLIMILFIDLLRASKFKQKIPLASKRSATLSHRLVGNIIPVWSWIIYVIVSLISLYHANEPKEKISTGIGIAVILVTAFFIEKRSKLPVSTTDDELYRRSEAWTIFFIAWFIPLVAPLKKYFGFYGVDTFFSTLPLLCFLIFLNSKIFKKLTDAV